MTAKPPRGDGPAVREPPAAARRSVSPFRPVPPMPSRGRLTALPVPLSVTVSRTCSVVLSTVISQRVASLCRTTLVTASRTTQPSSASVCGASGVPDWRTTGSTLAADSAERARVSSVAMLPSR